MNRRGWRDLPSVEGAVSWLLFGLHSARVMRRKLTYVTRATRRTGAAAIITKWEGGVGGLDRSIKSMVAAFRRHGLAVDVYTETRLPFSHYSVVNDDGVAVHVVDPGTALPDLDRYEFAYVFPYVSESIWAEYLTRTRAVTVGLGGLPYMGLPAYARFDLVHFESPASSRSIPRSVVAPPDATLDPRWLGGPPRPRDLPDDYVLSVFNPWGPVKGLDDMLTFLESSSRPVVWCYDAKSLADQGLMDKRELIERVERHPNVRVAKNRPIEEIYALYRHCSGYVSFSKSESFGWSLADAIGFGKPICSRKTGVLSYFEDFVPTIDFSRPEFCRLRVEADQLFGRNIVECLLRGR